MPAHRLGQPAQRPAGISRNVGHTKLESAVTYLGIEVDDGLEIAEQTEV
jgi:hypothetical protein